MSRPAAGVDDLPPRPAAGIRAVDRAGDRGGCIVLSWSLSPDDRVRFVPMAPGGYVTGPTPVYRTRGVSGYRLCRGREGEPLAPLAEVGAGTDGYLDSTVVDGVLYQYEVRVFDTRHEVAPAIEPGSAADMARAARSRNDALVPVDAAGVPVLGWFSPGDDTVDFNDFFLFADRFGWVDGQPGYAVEYDLDGDGVIAFGDFFLFADNFGRTVAGFAPAAVPD